MDKRLVIEINTDLMARQLLQNCSKCKAWTLQRDCPYCDETANAAAPMKWSPEDQRANIRRKMYNVESKEWLESLPSLEKITETRSNASEEE